MFIILQRVCHLAVRREAGVIFISTPAEAHAAEEDHLPIRVYHLNYVKSSDVMKMIQPYLSPKGKPVATPDATSPI